MKFIWDAKKTRFTNFSAIRNFTLEVKGSSVEIVGWFSDSESFPLRSCKDYDEAQKFLENMVAFYDAGIPEGIPDYD